MNTGPLPESHLLINADPQLQTEGQSNRDSVSVCYVYHIAPVAPLQALASSKNLIASNNLPLMSDLTAPCNDLLATQAGIQTYLRNTAFASHSVDLLSKGAANFTYRIHLHTPVDGKSTFILKYALAFATPTTPTGGITQIPITTDRQVYPLITSRIVYSRGNPTENGGGSGQAGSQ